MYLLHRFDHAIIAFMKEQARQYLEQKPLLHADMLAILTDPKAQISYLSGDALVLRLPPEYTFVTAESAAAQQRVLPLVCNSGLVVAHATPLRDVLVGQYGFETLMDCYNCAYQSLRPVPYELPRGAEIRTLTQADAPFVSEHYHAIEDPQYIRERIDAGMYGAWMDGALVGFVGTHDEHSMGMLEILPDYRHHGLAFSLEAHLINALVSQGVTPYCQVVTDNVASLNLQRKLGLTIGSDIVSWLKKRR